MIYITCIYFRLKQSRAKADVKLTLKIFFLLGLTWIFDIIAFAIEPYEHIYIGVQILIIIFLVINASHGIIFFFVVFLTSSTTKKIKIWCGGTNVGRMMTNYYSIIRTSTTTSSRTTRTTSIGKEPSTRKTTLQVRIRTSKNLQETQL